MAEKATPHQFRQSMGIRERDSVAPSLLRFVVLSAPVSTLDGKCVNDILNASVNTSLEWTKANMARKGWQPREEYTAIGASDPATIAYYKYFDL